MCHLACAYMHTGLAMQCLSKVGQLATLPVSISFARGLIRRLVAAPKASGKRAEAAQDSMAAVQQLFQLATVSQGQEAIVECDGVADILRWLNKAAEHDGAVSLVVEQSCQVITAMLHDAAPAMSDGQIGASPAPAPSERGARTGNQRRGKSAVPSSGQREMIRQDSNDAFLQNLVLIQEHAVEGLPHLVSAQATATSAPSQAPETIQISTGEMANRQSVQPLPLDPAKAESMQLEKGQRDPKRALSPRVVHIESEQSEPSPSKEHQVQQDEPRAVALPDVEASEKGNESRRYRKSKSPKKKSVASRQESDEETRPQAPAAVSQVSTHEIDGRADESALVEKQRRQIVQEQARRDEQVPRQRRPTHPKPTHTRGGSVHRSRRPTVETESSGRADRGSEDTCLKACVNRIAGIHHVKCVNHEDYVEAALVAPQAPVEEQALVRAMADRSGCLCLVRDLSFSSLPTHPSLFRHSLSLSASFSTPTLSLSPSLPLSLSPFLSLTPSLPPFLSHAP